MKYEFIDFLFSAWKIWKIPQTGWCTLVGLGSILKDFFDSYTQKYVDNLLGRALHPEKIALGIKLLHGKHIPNNTFYILFNFYPYGEININLYRCSY